VDLVIIYGAPGVGKLTVATELARLTGYRLFDNHISIDWALTLFERGTPPYGRLLDKLRFAVMEEAAQEAVDLIFTFVYAHPNDGPMLERLFEAVERHSARICLVRLMCDTDALEARIVSAERVGRKLASLAGLRAYLERYDLSHPIPARASLEIDNTHVEAAAVARRIAEHFDLQLTP